MITYIMWDNLCHIIYMISIFILYLTRIVGSLLARARFAISWITFWKEKYGEISTVYKFSNLHNKNDNQQDLDDPNQNYQPFMLFKLLKKLLKINYLVNLNFHAFSLSSVISVISSFFTSLVVFPLARFVSMEKASKLIA